MHLSCIAIVTLNQKGIITKGAGKRRLVSCGKNMKKIDDFTYQCSSGHKRKYPLEEWTNQAFKGFYQTQTTKEDHT